MFMPYHHYIKADMLVRDARVAVIKIYPNRAITLDLKFLPFSFL